MLALVIGNANYKTLQQLDNPINDAKAMAAKFRARGAIVFEGYDCTIDEMDEVKEKLLHAVRPGDFVIIFFAGHGVEFENANRLMAIGTSENVDYKRDSWNVHRLLNALKRMLAAFALLLLDCCREFRYALAKATRGIHGGSALATRSRGGERPLHDFQSDMESMVAFACEANHPAFDSDGGGHGPYALDPTCLRMNEM